MTYTDAVALWELQVAVLLIFFICAFIENSLHLRFRGIFCAFITWPFYRATMFHRPMLLQFNLSVCALHSYTEVEYEKYLTNAWLQGMS